MSAFCLPHSQELRGWSCGRDEEVIGAPTRRRGVIFLEAVNLPPGIAAALSWTINHMGLEAAGQPLHDGSRRRRLLPDPQAVAAAYLHPAPDCDLIGRHGSCVATCCGGGRGFRCSSGIAKASRRGRGRGRGMSGRGYDWLVCLGTGQQEAPT